MNFLKFDNPIFAFLTRLCDIFILNILWVICSIPIVTIGAATTALYYSLIKINRERDSSISEMFFYSFKQNLKQACIMTMIFILGGLVLYVDIQICEIIDNAFGIIIKAVIIALLICWEMIISYAFPLLAQFDNTIKNTIKNAFIISISNMGKTLIVVILNTVPIILYCVFPYFFAVSLPFWLLGGIALIAVINTKMFVEIFDKYITNEEST